MNPSITPREQFALDFLKCVPPWNRQAVYSERVRLFLSPGARKLAAQIRAIKEAE